MLSNYLKIALRQLWRNRLFSVLNLVGLTVGLAVSTFIALYVWHEFHYDRFHPFAERTYRIMCMSKFGGEEVFFPGLHESFGRLAKQQIPEIDEFVRWSDGTDVVLQSDVNHQFKEENIGFADASILTVMGFDLLYGNKKTALTAPGQIVLTRPLAEKYFGVQNPVGKTLLFDKHFPLTVSGVLKDLPTNSVIQFNALVSLPSMSTLGPKHRELFKQYGMFTTYLVLRPDANVSTVTRKLKRVTGGFQFGDLKAEYLLESMPSLHLYSRTDQKGEARQSLYILLTIALVILALAIINYISMTTARATKRAREVGIRKAVGGQRRELIFQFFLESFLTTTLAFATSLLVLQGIFSWANEALDLHMDNRVLGQGPYWGVMLVLWLGCSLLAGAYPALLLSGFRPALILKGTLTTRYSGAGLRRTFTTVQFTASIGLLICSLVLFAQMRFLRTRSIGIDRAQVVAMHIDGDMQAQLPALRDAIRGWAGPANVATTNTRLFTSNVSTWFVETKKTKKQLMVNALTVDKSFFDMMGIRWLYRPDDWAARPVTSDLTVYNQTAIREAGITGNPLQQPAPFKYDSVVAGVIADFHVHSLHGPVSAMRLTVVSDTNRSIMANGGYVLVRLNPNTNVGQALDQLKAIYDRQQPTAPFDYYFLDDAYNQLYAREDRLARLFNAFTGLTLLVACLGLLGLMTFNVEARTKEIGIRKVLGASVASIVALLSKDFMKLVLLAIVIASPIAWYAMNQWLQQFTYKIDIRWWMFALAGGLAALVAVLTISFQSIKAALMNPVKSLRTD